MKRTKLFWKVILDRDRKIRFGNAAAYRLQSLPNGFDFEDLGNDRKRVAALTDIVWAMLCDGDEIKTPAEVAEVMPFGEPERITAIVQAVQEAIAEVSTPNETKNESSGKSPTPGSTAD